jgi:Ser/Thr protein kinase RdoA (MazF antagonist)
VKEYDGVDGLERLRVEVAALGRLADVVPVPKVLSVDLVRRRAVLTAMSGRHGQDLLDEGFAPQVLAAAGRTLRELNRSVPGLVHGDYGPQNLLLELAAWEVAAVLDWEFAHEGDPIDDLAWAEWIVRMHHPEAVGALFALFAGYGSRPPWDLRHDAMVGKCVRLGELCRRRGQIEGAELWDRRQRATRAWTE